MLVYTVKASDYVNNPGIFVRLARIDLARSNARVELFNDNGGGYRLYLKTTLVADVFSFGGGRMTLKSAMGDIPIVAPPFKLDTTADGVANAGVFDGDKFEIANGTYNGQAQGISFLTNASSIGGLSGAQGNFAQVKDALDKVGMKFGGDNMGLGIALGKYIKNRIMEDAPINDGVPYIYLNAMSRAPKIQQGGIELSFGSTNGLGLLFDPADPFFYFEGAASAVGEVALGYSHRGHIPYEANNKLDSRVGELFGNVYTRADIAIPVVPGIDLGLKGSAVIDLDANNDGSFGVSAVGSSFSKQGFRDLISGKRTTEVFLALLDASIGLNGDVSLDFGKKNFGLKVPVGSASMMYKGLTDQGTNPRVAFAGGTVDAFKDTILSRFQSNQTIGISGFADSTGSFVTTFEVKNMQLNGATFSGSLTVNNSEVAFNAKLDSVIPGFGQGTIIGSIGFDGNFLVVAGFSRGIDLGPFSVSMGATLGLGTWDPTVYAKGRRVVVPFYAKGGFSDSGSANIVIGKIYGDLGANFDFDVSGNFNASGRFEGGFEPLVGKNVSIGIGFTANRTGFSIRMPKGVKDVNVRF